MANPYPSRPPPHVTGYPAAPPPNGHPPYTTTAYPSQNYPYNPHHAPPLYQQQPPPRATFLRRIIFASLLLFVIFGSILFITWLIFRPTLPEFSLTNLSVSKLNITSQPQQRIAANFNFTLEAYNPNRKMSAIYDAMEGYVSYKHARLIVTALPPFDQPTKSRHVVAGSMSIAGSYVDDSVVLGIKEERDRHGSVGFGVNLLASVWFKSGAWRTRRRVIQVECTGGAVGVDKFGNGRMNGGSRRCKVLF